MTTPIQPVASSVQIAGTEELLAAVPHLLGFHPHDSLVVIGLQGNDPMTIGLTLRVDLPPPEHHDAVAEQLAIPLAKHETAGVVLLIVGGSDGAPPGAPSEQPPHRALTTRLELTFARIGIPVVHRLWLPDTERGARWSCYDDSDCRGTLPDPSTTPLAAASVVAGAVTVPRRADLVAGLMTADGPALARRARLLETASRDREPGGDTTALTTARFAAVRAAIDRSVDGLPTLTDDDVLALSDALSDHRVRDACLIQEQDKAAAAEHLWTALTRATPAPERAEAACLLAFAAYLRGDGVLAGIALEQAEEADAGHRLTSLLRNSLLFGLPPYQLRAACVQAAELARQQLSEEAQP
ncbi:MAG TPA: DUF4192 domain-containing protein [Pseudonocardiaceae bacterium]|nr:DUF4192 domain-containing protein [Pseudonocardiaceae bacterium]